MPDAARFGLSDSAIICGHCHGIRGVIRDSFLQWCGCKPNPPTEEVPGFDCPEAAERCRCCARVLLRSGSKWSIWFCSACKERVTSFNNSIGFYVFPVGRHSIMARVALSGVEAKKDLAVSQTVQDLGSWLEQVNWLEEWSRAREAHNVDRLGFDSASDVLLTTYLTAIAASTDPDLAAPNAFSDLVAALGSSRS